MATAKPIGCLQFGRGYPSSLQDKQPSFINKHHNHISPQPTRALSLSLSLSLSFACSFLTYIINTLSLLLSGNSIIVATPTRAHRTESPVNFQSTSSLFPSPPARCLGDILRFPGFFFFLDCAPNVTILPPGYFFSFFGVRVGVRSRRRRLFCFSQHSSIHPSIVVPSQHSQPMARPH